MLNKPETYRPQIFDFRSLFVGRDQAYGFPARASILITGAPGTGKSFMALSLARGLLFTGDAAQPLRRDHVIYFVSAELDGERLERNFKATGWFDPGDEIFDGWKTNPDCPFSLISARVDLGRPVPTSEELVNGLLVDLRERHANRPPNTRALIVVDSLTALLRDCRDRGEERRQTHEFIRRLETALRPENLALTLFITEESGGHDTTVKVEDYVVDFVIRLGLNKTAGGRRLRTFEVLKSHGAYLRVGLHTWAIVTREGAGGVIAEPELAKAIGRLAGGTLGLERIYFADPDEPSPPTPGARSPSGKPWATVAIFASGALRPVGELQDNQPPPPSTLAEPPDADRVSTGIPGLDHMLVYSAEDWNGHMKDEGRKYWTERELGIGDGKSELPKHLIRGSTTVISGLAGAGKTNMCLQFLTANEGHEDQSLFVNFELPIHEVIDRFPNRKLRGRFAPIHGLFRRRGNLDLNLLLSEVRFTVRKFRIERIAIDGLSSLLATTGEEEYAQLIERLLSTIADLAAEVTEDVRKQEIEGAIWPGNAERFPGRPIEEMDSRERACAAFIQSTLEQCEKVLRATQLAMLDVEAEAATFKAAAKQASDDSIEPLASVSPEDRKRVVAAAALNALAGKTRAMADELRHRRAGQPGGHVLPLFTPEIYKDACQAAAEARYPEAEDRATKVRELAAGAVRLYSEYCEPCAEASRKSRATIDLLDKAWTEAQAAQLPSAADLCSYIPDRSAAAIANPCLNAALGVRPHSITLFITYEPAGAAESERPGDGLHMEIPRLSAMADNIVVIRPVMIEDEVRQAVYLAKVRGANYDRTVRQIRVRSDQPRPVCIEPGLESYTGLLSGQPQPVSLSLQLFHENHAEETYNTRLQKRLTHVFKYDVTIFGFSRTAISRTLRELSAPELRFPASHVRVLTLDEWVVQDIDRAGRNVAWRALLPLTPFDSQLYPADPSFEGNRERPLPENPLSTRSIDFWVWDIAKCRFTDGEGKPSHLVALPLSADYGMFCINARLAHRLRLEGFESFDRFDFRDAQKLADLGKFNRRIALEKLPWRWAVQKGDWFQAPDASAPQKVLVDLMKAAVDLKPEGPGKCWGFTFDLATPETAAVMYLELCWSFGATEDVFGDHSKEISEANQKAGKWAMRFLMFLVSQGLMPPEATLYRSSDALFSRHFFSTFCDCVRPPPADECGSGRVPVPLVILPFMPFGLGDDDTQEKDRANRLMWAGKRPDKKSYKLPNKKVSARPFAKLPELPGNNSKADWTAFDVERESSKGQPHTGDADWRDTVEFLERHGKRVEMMKTKRPYGYSCSGTWMIGVHGHTHSPGLSCKIIDEMTSLGNVVERAQCGAGMPARKDFYEFYGADAVPHAPYLQWHELLTECCSRARRRQFAVGPRAKVGEMNEIIHENVRAAIKVTALQPTSNPNTARLSRWADDFAERIFHQMVCRNRKPAPPTQEPRR